MTRWHYCYTTDEQPDVQRGSAQDESAVQELRRQAQEGLWETLLDLPHLVVLRAIDGLDDFTIHLIHPDLVS